MSKTTLLMAMALVLAPAMNALAGMDYAMKCESCGFEADVRIGGGRKFEQITGFCANSMKFVYLRWKRGEKGPEPIGKVWDSAAGKTIDVHKCPDCSKPFLAIQVKDANRKSPGFDHCPKCGKQTFRGKLKLLYD
jgi:hypothetical protein